MRTWFLLTSDSQTDGEGKDEPYKGSIVLRMLQALQQDNLQDKVTTKMVTSHGALALSYAQ